MKRIELSRSAEADLIEIDNYTIEHFGLHQAEEALEAFRAKLLLLAEYPESGQLREDLCPPGRPFRFQLVLSFVIVYEATKAGIRIARILHGARHLSVELERDAGDV